MRTIAGTAVAVTAAPAASGTRAERRASAAVGYLGEGQNGRHQDERKHNLHVVKNNAFVVLCAGGCRSVLGWQRR